MPLPAKRVFTSKGPVIGALVIAQVCAMAVWFSAAAVLPSMLAEGPLAAWRQAFLTAGVQAGFALGAVAYAILGLADRYDPRTVFSISAVLAALSNAALLIVPIGGDLALTARVATGAFLAGVYPVGMKLAVGWGKTDRGLLVGLIVGALALGSAAPHLIALGGGADWRLGVAGASLCALFGAALCQGVALGPLHARAARFDPAAIKLAWTHRPIRQAYGGYLGHMWELYAFWAWIGVALAARLEASLSAEAAARAASWGAFWIIASGSVACVLAGLAAGRFGKSAVAKGAMAGSAIAAMAAALTYGAAPWIFVAVCLVWGAAVIADSAQFSAIVADEAPPESVGTLMTLQTALGFGLTLFTVQLTPLLAGAVGWPGAFMVMALGPIAGIAAMGGLSPISARAR